MKKSIKILYGLSMVGCVGGILLHWKTGQDLLWPTIALIWCINAFSNELKNYDE